jgi:hypothetical protein
MVPAMTIMRLHPMVANLAALQRASKILTTLPMRLPHMVVEITLLVVRTMRRLPTVVVEVATTMEKRLLAMVVDVRNRPMVINKAATDKVARKKPAMVVNRVVMDTAARRTTAILDAIVMSIKAKAEEIGKMITLVTKSELWNLLRSGDGPASVL